MDPAAMYRIAAQDEFPGTFISVMNEAKHGWVNIGQDIYAFLATSTASKMRLLESVFEKIGLNGEDLSFEIRPEAEE